MCGSRTLFKSKHDWSCDLFRICTVGRARKLINAAALFQDVVFDRISVHQDESSIFAADILAHKDCIKKYIKRYDDHIENILYNLELEANVANNTDDIAQAFDQVVNQLDIEHKGYTLSTIRDKINSILGDEGVHVTNRQVKSMLIERYKEGIVFTYPETKRSSQMFFGNNIQAIDIAETLKKCDRESVKTVTSKIEEEIKVYDFALDQSFCSSNDVLISSYKLSKLMFETGTFDVWNAFIQCLFKSKNINSEGSKVMKETLFQIVYYIYHNGAKLTPFHLALAETIHTMTRSKHLITILNKRKLCVSYDTLERIDIGLGQKVISELPLGQRVPLDKPKLSQDHPINGAMDNFDSADSHDTILIIFQNVKKLQDQIRFEEITEKNLLAGNRNRSISLVLPCQELISMGAVRQRGKLKDDFKPSSYTVPTESNIEYDFFTWLMVRQAKNFLPQQGVTPNFIPSFTAIRSVLKDLLQQLCSRQSSHTQSLIWTQF